MMLKSVGFIVLVLRCCARALPGDRAKAACAAYGRNMPECHNILHPESRVRIRVDLLLYPHMVLLGYGNASRPDWKCGGSIISPEWILTAAHCVIDPASGPVQVLRAGTSTFEFDDSEDAMQERLVVERVSHPDFKPPSKYGDIALLKADPPFHLSRDIRPACLHVEKELRDTNATVIGFGATESSSNKGSQTLMAVDVDIVDSSQCNETVKQMIRRGLLSQGVTESQLCAGDWRQGGRDACRGDSGAPLMRSTKYADCVHFYPLWYAIGVTSFGRFCGFKKAPGIYTRLSYYVDWIEDIVWPN